VNAGTAGISGMLVFSSGTSNSGNSGSISIGSGKAAKGAGGVVSITVGSGSKNAGGKLSIVAGSSTDAAVTATGQGGSIELTAGAGKGATGGTISLLGGAGTAHTSGSIVIKTRNAGTNGISGSLVFSSGTSTSGYSGSLSLGTGTAVKGKAGDIAVTVGSGDQGGGAITLTAGGSSHASNTAGDVAITAGTSTTSGGTGGNVVVKAGPNTGSGTKGEVYIKDAANANVVKVDEAIFQVNAASIDMDASGTFAMTGASGVTIEAAGSNTVTVNSHLVMSSSKYVYAEGGLVVGRSCSAATCDSGSATIAAANYARILKGSLTIDCSSNDILPGAEREFTLAISTAVDGDMVQVWPNNEAQAGAVSVFWRAFACTDCLTSSAAGITIRISNQAASTVYSGSGTWYFVIYKFQ